jgi:Fe-S cluster assembly protein SufD
MKESDPYLAEFERFDQAGAGGQPSWVHPIRKAGMARFAELGFPTLHDEDWRFTNVAPIAQMPFLPQLDPQEHRLQIKDLAKFNFMNIKASRLVFVDGHFAGDLSNVLPQKNGAHIGSLASALAAHHPIIEKHLAQYARTEKNAFTALNTAFFTDGAFIHLPEKTASEFPVHLLFISSGREVDPTFFPRNLIVAEKGSELTLLESYVSLADKASITNAVTEFVAGEHSVIEHCKLQDESLSAFHMAALQVTLGRSANFISHSIAIGARLSRNNIHTALEGQGVECILNGLYLTKDQQLADHWMFVEHARPNCNSHEYFNGILDGHSKGVFHGRIYVHQAAQKTDAKQTNKNLLLSDDATVDTKPQLEIYADDVKCTHGATVGQLNEDAIFYLRARGLDLDTAKRMLIHSFAGEITERVRLRSAREELDQMVWDRLEQNERVAVK